MEEQTFLTRIQEEHKEWIEKNFPGESLEQRTLGVCEEAGELAHHVLKLKQGIRGSDPYHEAEIMDAIGDICIFAMGVCDVLDVDFGQVIKDTWMKVKERDWVANPQDGGEVPEYVKDSERNYEQGR